MTRVAILTSERNPIAIDLFLALRAEAEAWVMFTARGRRGLERAAAYLQRPRGLRWLLYDLLLRAAQRRYRAVPRPRRPWEEVAAEEPERFLRVAAHAGERTRRLLGDLDLDLGVLIGTRLIPPEIFSVPRLGMINLHQGDLGRVRGAPPAYWEHRLGLGEICVTVHRVVARFDAGAVLARRCIPLAEHFALTKLEVNRISPALLTEGVRLAVAGAPGTTPGQLGPLRTVPRFAELLMAWTALLRSPR